MKVKEAKKKKQAREDLERETELGKTRQHLHNEKGNQVMDSGEQR